MPKSTKFVEMEQLLYDNMKALTGITPEAFAVVEAAMTKRAIKKKTYLLREGMSGQPIAFVTSGCLRAYSVDETGLEHVTQFALENYWIGDLYSFLNHTPATLNIEAIEDSVILVLEHQQLEDLYKNVPVLERYFRILFQNAYTHIQQRLNATLTAPAAERYADLVARHPAIAQRVPLIHIASYLGITPESLSRIRRKLQSGT